MHYAIPLVAPNTALLIAAVSLWGWPVLVTGVTAAFRWSDLRSRVGFLVLGYLSCVGISALAPKVAGYFHWVYVVPATAQDQLVVVAINESIGATVAGVVLSIFPVIWLAKLLGSR